MSPTLHLHDLPDNLSLQGDIAIDTEATGLRFSRDRLCLVQLQDEAGACHLVQFNGQYEAPNLTKLLVDPSRVKILHFARFDVAILAKFLGVYAEPIFCTKIASRLVRTYTERHGLKDLTREVLGVDMNKQQQSSDWAASELSKEQIAYAASDVKHLHALREKLSVMLEREGRLGMAEECFRFLSTRAALDLAGWVDEDIFAH
jgi:ribonuclease D